LRFAFAILITSVFAAIVVSSSPLSSLEQVVQPAMTLSNDSFDSEGKNNEAFISVQDYDKQKIVPST
jgi:hypothetical protein